MHDHFLTFIRLLNEEEVEYVVTNFISYQELILNKKAVGRPKDLLDLENLSPLGGDTHPD